ncbi:uncharacterized protein LY89DRAFT_770640 [Mollisia scopiformis]|uniref:Acyltransferase 3 domain-containing protein n=1 Tax=Mollisia scopiformis TaxID=149040 RepID=A0A194XMC3_MOLSC|nr:uncharacterized protein LY89DRAFT_770640 [Mollisia scopiformis]KUJ21328.1 hypothetical protein LY89DRAFT_770640 [Mollisia scopiformis]
MESQSITDSHSDSDDDDSILDLELGELIEKTTTTPPTTTTKFLALFKSFLITILPSFIQPFFRSHSQPEPPPPTKSDRNDALTYLTGIRGVASVIVFIYHWTHGTYKTAMDHAYGDPNTSPPNAAQENNHILQLPLLRLLYAAEAMVALFFILSGYVLSYKFIQQIHHNHNHNPHSPLVTATTTLSNLAFRRGPRLFLPALAATLLASLLQLLGAIPLPHSHPPNSTALANLLIFLQKLLMSGIWTWDTIPGPGWGLHPHLWTVPTEFRCSMVLFVLLLSLAQRSSGLRLGIEGVVVVWCLVAGRWDVALFVAGAAGAELRVRREEGEGRGWVKSIAWGILLVLGLLLASYPPIPPPAASTPVYGPLAKLVNGNPEGRRIFYALGAMFILASLDHLPAAQGVFRSRLALYFGRISYSLYLVHGVLIRAVGQRVLDEVFGWRGGRIEGWAFGVRFAVASTVFVPLVVWGADLFERGVEGRAVVFIRKL